MKAFKNIGGLHSQGGTLYPNGAIIKTNKPLDKMFKNHFLRIDPRVADLDTGEATDIPDETTSGDDTNAQLEALYGKNVSGDFENTDEYGVLVFKKKGKFILVDAEDSKKLSKQLAKKAVQAAVDEYEPEEDEDEDDDEDGEDEDE